VARSVLARLKATSGCAPGAMPCVGVSTTVGCSSEGWKAVLNENTLNLRYRVLAGYRILPGFSVFAGGGLRQRKADFDPELSVGMELL